MAEIKLPYIFPEMDGGLLLKWFIQPGQHVEIDQDIARLRVGDEEMVSPLDGQVKTLCVRRRTSDGWGAIVILE